MTSFDAEARSARRVWALAFGLAVLVVLAAGYLYYRAARNDIRKEKSADLASIGELKADQIHEWRKERLADAGRLAGTPRLREVAAEVLRHRLTEGQRSELRKYLQLEQQSYGYADALLLSADGQVLLAASDDPGPGGAATKDAAEQARSLGGAVLSDFYRCPRSEVHLDTVAPVTDAAGRLAMMLVLRSDARAEFWKHVQTWPSPSPSAETLLVRREGDAVLFLNELRHQSETALALRRPLTREDIPAVQAVKGRRGIFEGLDYRGVRVLADLRPVPDTPWFLVAKVDRSEMLAEAQTRAVLVGLLAACLILLVAALVVVGYRRRQAGIYRRLYEAEQGRSAEREQFRTTLYSIGDGVITCDRQGRVQQVNPVAEQLTGYSEADARGRPLEEVFRIVNEDSRATVQNPVERVLREGVVVALANHTLLIARDGTERPIADSGAPIRDEDGTIIGVVLVFRDQTQARAAQRHLETEKNNLEAVFQASPVGILVIDASECVTQVNPAAREMFGREPVEGQPFRCGDALGCVNRVETEQGCGYSSQCPDCPIYAAVRRALTENLGTPSQDTEMQMLGEDEEALSRWLTFSVEPMTVNGQRHALVALSDIDDRKRAETRLAHLNSVLRAIRDLNQVIVREDDRIQLIQRCCDILVSERGFHTAWIRLDDGTDRVVVGAGSDGAAFEAFRERFGGDDVPACCRLARESAELRPFDPEQCGDCPLVGSYDDAVRVTVCLSYGPRRYGCLGVSVPAAYGRDPEEMALLAEIAADLGFALHAMETEAERQRAHETVRAIFDGAADGILLVDAETRRFVNANQAICGMLGYSPEEIAALTVDEIHPPESLEAVSSSFEQQILGKLTLQEDFLVRRKDGSVFPAQIASSPLELDGRPHILGIFRDITHRKQAEADLQESREYYRAIVESQSDAVTRWLPDTTLTFANSRYMEILGLDPSDIGRFRWIDSIPEDEREQVTSIYRDVVEHPERGRREYEHHVRQADGELRFYHWIDTPLVDEDGACVEVQSVGRDITDIKRAEEQLRFRNLILSTQQEVSLDGILVVDENRKIISYNRRFVSMWGIPYGVMESRSDAKVFRSVQDKLERPAEFMRQMELLYATPTESGQDEIVMKDGRIFQRYSAPMIGPGRQCYGRVWYFRDVTAEKQSEAALRESEAFIRTVMDCLPIGIAVNTVMPVTFSYMNANFHKIYRTTRKALSKPGTFWEAVYPDPKFREELKQRVLDDIASGDPKRMFWSNVPIVREGEEAIYIDAMNVPIPGQEMMISLVWDVTDRKRSEQEIEKLREQAVRGQKLEAIGRLAGGVAHDFNNILTGISGYAELLADELDADSQALGDVEEIRRLAYRAAELTQQLLAFSRRQTIKPVVLNINRTVETATKMLRRLIGEDIDLEIHLHTDVGNIVADPGQIEQVLTNLTINARDAMPTGGKLTIEVSNVDLDAEYADQHVSVTPGPHVMLAVTDTGCGMDAETRKHVFEPFFTTKKTSGGTGLGLATIYGIVRQHGGNIWVYSEPGKGTTFRAYFPRVELPTEADSQEDVEPVRATGTETILVVEDEPAVRDLAGRILGDCGYTVHQAGNADEAEAVMREVDHVALLLTDVVMPGRSGRELYEALAPDYPSLKVLYMSGYTENAIVHHGVLEKGIRLLQKPFTPQALARRVREVLDSDK